MSVVHKVLNLLATSTDTDSMIIRISIIHRYIISGSDNSSIES